MGRNTLYLAAHPQNSAVVGTRTSMQLTNLPNPSDSWSIKRPDGEIQTLRAERGMLQLELVVDNHLNTVTRSSTV